MQAEAIEQALQAPPNDTIADAMEIAQQDHHAAFGFQAAQAEYIAKQRDAEREFLEARQAEDASHADYEGFAPNVDLSHTARFHKRLSNERRKLDDQQIQID
jgi:hypothetical protein